MGLLEKVWNYRAPFRWLLLYFFALPTTIGCVLGYCLLGFYWEHFWVSAEGVFLIILNCKYILCYVPFIARIFILFGTWQHGLLVPVDAAHSQDRTPLQDSTGDARQNAHHTAMDNGCVLHCVRHLYTRGRTGC